MSKEDLSTQNLEKFSLWISGQIMKGILLEVSCPNKPGLVGPNSSGIHQDMDFSLFMKSSAAISPFFPKIVDLGIKYADSPNKILIPLKIIGLQAEKAMFVATNGINTQKGLIFSSALLAAGSGMLLSKTNDLKLSAESICFNISKISAGIVKRELEQLQVKKEKPSEKLTNGEKLYLEYGITGIRGEAEKGFPTAKRGYNYFKREITEGRKLNDVLLETLFQIISTLEDTTILIKGKEKATWARERASKFLKKGGFKNYEGFEELKRINSEFHQKGISPGGAADMLSLAISLFLIENEQHLYF